MRLDLFLKASRLCQRRTVAQKLCEAGLVLINGQPAKSAHTVKPGDEITFRRRARVTKMRVLLLPAARQTSRKDAPALFEVLSEESLATAQVDVRTASGSDPGLGC
ncbi:MAG: RNA-binding S4 domain-containing protein [Pyrinomonadaceae bacterium]|nr:RNA-binding S4 domain-containing protein [Pyrinomonadaceae bacterium]